MRRHCTHYDVTLMTWTFITLEKHPAEVGGGENVPAIPDACAIRNFTYLVRGQRFMLLVDSYDLFNRVFQSYFTGTGTIIRQSHRWWRDPEKPAIPVKVTLNISGKSIESQWDSRKYPG